MANGVRIFLIATIKRVYGYNYYNTTVKPLSVFAETPSFEYVYASCHRQTDLAAGLLL